MAKYVYIYIALQLLFWLRLNFTFVCASTSAAENVAFNVTEYKIDLMHEMLARILAKADPTSNFLIAPQEALKLYQQLHGADEEMTANESSTYANGVVELNGKKVESHEMYPMNSNDAVRNEIESYHMSRKGEFEEFFHISASPILVSNRLYANADTANKLTPKLENLEYVLHEESVEYDTNKCCNNTNSNKHNNNSEVDSATRNTVMNMSAGAGNAMNTIHKANNNSQHNHNSNNNKHLNELINAVRINSRWAHNFQKRDTHKRRFHMPQRHASAYLNAMRKDDIFPYANLEGLNASALELSLQRWQLKMLIILPDAKHGLSQLLQRLSANVTLLDELCGMQLGTIGSQRPHFDSNLVRVILPKFQFTQRVVLDDIFQQLLNVTTNVDLHRRRPYQVIQEAHFAVNEDGIGELEPSMVMFWNAFSSLRTKPLMFCVDHPFLFIVHNRQGIQLLGHLAQLHD